MTPNSPTTARQFFPELEGLRGVAILLVLVSHFGLASGALAFVTDLGLGHIGVRLFFVLSGFLITDILLRDLEAAHANRLGWNRVFLKFYTSRVLRIFPVYYLTITALYLIDFEGFREIALWHYAYLSNLDGVRYVTTEVGTALRHPSTAHFWSLAIEEQFYLIYPVLVLSLKRRALLLVLCAAIVTAPVWRLLCIFVLDPRYPHSGLMLLPGLMDSLCIGALAALYRNSPSLFPSLPQPVIRGVSLLAGALAAALFVLNAQDVAVRAYLALFDSTVSVLCALLILYFIGAPGVTPAARFLRLAAMRLVGRISYGLYIYHAFATHILSWLYPRVGLAIEPESSLHTGLLYIMAFTMAYTSWHLLERPLLALKPRLAKRLVASTGKLPTKVTV
ncbi:acyltransferase family protein [Microbulbifer sediminum]|uniref:acyltransferase family protein n=1 Tax=Microbulbifer sediminum TaxID=2904250 RepID=UPI0021079C6E|nr:acyltransferase [Microbulbifer sediminum]